MATLTLPEIPKDYDAPAIEARCRTLWEESGIYRYDPDAPGEVFSVDTPPPYVSAAHLHVGHAMSYTQAEIIIRYQRMKGRKVFYPMGFDDNGLPTERYVEKTYNINKRLTTRADFRKLCLKETRKGAAQYEELWRGLGLSVDWTLRYSTIDDHCRKTAQKSFLDLFKKGRVYRSNEPVLWDVYYETALAQADLDSMARKGKLHDVAFTAKAYGAELVISTTRPELIPACVALYHHPEDARYTHLKGTTAIVPLFGHEVPILPDEAVDPAFGTGLMMVCTFGDGEDVRKWKRDKLATRLVIGADGKMLPAAGPFAGLTAELARNAIVVALVEGGFHRKSITVEQNVSIAERSGVPVEFNMAPQWFIRVLDIKPQMLARSAEINWNPPWMKVRLDHWIEGLKYDWNISRQRFYGVPFPLWYCVGCGEPTLADEASLPVDPVEDACPIAACANCGGTEFRGESDVMDTWMTSSLTPLINANWAESPGRKGGMELHPMTVRVQAFEIIRTWLFYTLIKSDAHLDTLPWKDVMISGWGLNENGKKISKSDLEKYTDKDGYNRYEPFGVINKFGADALRYWAAGSHLGHDMRFNEKDVKDGRKLAVKLWNAARFVLMQIEGFDPEATRPTFSERQPEDRWLLTELNKIVPVVSEGFETYNYAVARESVDRFFWATFCDDYLEMVKHRFWKPELYTEAARVSARATLWEALRVILGLYAPFVPFTTEDLYQAIYRPVEGTVSLHVTKFPEFDAERTAEVPEMLVVGGILRAVRQLRTEARLSQTRALEVVVVDLSAASDSLKQTVEAMKASIQAVSRAGEVRIDAATYATEVEGLTVGIVAGELPEKTPAPAPTA